MSICPASFISILLKKIFSKTTSDNEGTKPYNNISLKSLAVVVIDMQDEFLDFRTETRRIIPKIVDVLGFCKKKSIPVAIIEYKNKGETTCLIKKASQELNAVVFIKNDCDTFSEKSFRNWLSEKKVKTLLVMGIYADACVYDTVKSALNKYAVITNNSIIEGYWSQGSQERMNTFYEQNTTVPENIMDFLNSLE